MKPIRTSVACLLVCCLLGAAPLRAAARGRIKLYGHVALDNGERPRFTLRLYFPKAANRPPIVTATGENGWYEFTELDAGRYLLEVYRGEELVYQKVVVLEGDQQHDVPLRAKKGSD